MKVRCVSKYGFFLERIERTRTHCIAANRVEDTDKRKFAPDVCATLTHHHTQAATIPFRFSVRFGSITVFTLILMHSTFTCSAFARGVSFMRSRSTRRREIFALLLAVQCRFAFTHFSQSADSDSR